MTRDRYSTHPIGPLITDGASQADQYFDRYPPEAGRKRCAFFLVAMLTVERNQSHAAAAARQSARPDARPWPLGATDSLNSRFHAPSQAPTVIPSVQVE